MNPSGVGGGGGGGRYGGHVTHSSTSLDSRAEESRARERSYSRDTDRDATRDSNSHRDITMTTRKDETFRSKEDVSSLSADRHESYDFYYPEKTEYSCDEAGGWQKLSFLLLVIAFLGHCIAVCTPYWVVAYENKDDMSDSTEQMVLYEGVWLSCLRERGFGSWVCSNYDTLRGLFEQPGWYQAAQVSAVLSIILLIPALITATLYSYVVALRGRSRASWVLLVFMICAGVCAFLSFVIYAAGYPIHQTFPPGDARFHVSFGLQIISFLLLAAAVATHLKDSYATLTVWDNHLPPNCGPSVSCAPSSSHTYKVRGSRPSAGSRSAPVASSASKSSVGGSPQRSPDRSPFRALSSFSMPKFPAALSRFRPGGGQGQGRGQGQDRPAPSAPPSASRSFDARETTAERAYEPVSTVSGSHSQRAVASAHPEPYRSRAPASESGTSAHDSVV